MYLGSLESTQKARVALGCASSYSYAFFVLSKLPARTITRYTHAKHEEILIFFRGHLQRSTVLQLSIYSDSQKVYGFQNFSNNTTQFKHGESTYGSPRRKKF